MLEAPAKFLARIKPTPDLSLNEPNFKEPRNQPLGLSTCYKDKGRARTRLEEDGSSRLNTPKLMPD